MEPLAAKPVQINDFDKLRKRVAYLSYGRKKNLAKNSQVPQNMQIHD